MPFFTAAKGDWRNNNRVPCVANLKLPLGNGNSGNLVLPCVVRRSSLTVHAAVHHECVDALAASCVAAPTPSNRNYHPPLAVVDRRAGPWSTHAQPR